MLPPTLVIGNKNYSSWSRRPWLAMRQTDIPFEQGRIPLYPPESRVALEKSSPSGKVPARPRPDAGMPGGHRTRRGDLDDMPYPVRGGRGVPLRVFFDSRRHVRAGGTAFPDLRRGAGGQRPGLRFDRHKAGIQSNRFVKTCGLRLLPELCERYGPLSYHEASALEVELAIDFREAAYGVWQA